MKYRGLIRARKATMGGLAIKLDPYIFQQLVERGFSNSRKMLV